MSEPDTEERRTAQIIAPEQEPQSESDQGCDPATPAAEGMLVEADTEDWLIELNMEVLTSTISYLVFPPATAGSSFPSGMPQSSVTPALATLALPQMLVVVASLRFPVPAMSLSSCLRPWIHRLCLRCSSPRCRQPHLHLRSSLP